MNHIYRIVWNACASVWQVVSETANGNGKSAGGKNGIGAHPMSALSNEPSLRLPVLCIGLALQMWGAASHAGPEGGSVVRGAASIQQNGGATVINQSTDRAVINWNSFSVGPNEFVRFNQPNSQSATLNRVTGTESSNILGSMSAKGRVFLLNPNGVLVGQGAQVNVGGFTASTLGMNDGDFMANRLNLSGGGAAAVRNEGHISVSPGGTVVLIAPEVSNTGSITAPQGSVLLAAASSLSQGATSSGQSGSHSGQIASGGGNTADRFTLRLQDGSQIAFTIDQGAVNAMVNNGGLIRAEGGHIILTAKGRDELSKATVNHSGVIEAQTLTTRNGVVELLADMKVGTVNLSGSINAAAVAPVPTPEPVLTTASTAPPAPSTPAFRGGFVETSAARVNVADSARVTTAGQIDAGIKTGAWLIDPVDFVIASSGGNMTGAALSNALNNSDVIVSTVPGQGTFSPSASQAQGNGDIFVNDFVSWRANTLTLNAERNIQINRSMSGTDNAKLALEFGQATVDGVGSAYRVNQATISLDEGLNFSTKRGSSGAITEYTVITRLGVEGDTSTRTLQGAMNALNGNFVLGANIDASSTSAWNGGSGFAPIGSNTSAYTGTFDGFNHTISDLYINRTGWVGLFGYATGDIKRVKLENMTVNAPGPSAVGSIVGGMQGTLSDSSASGRVSNLVGTSSVGGLVGSMGPTGRILRSHSSVDLVANHAAGGLVGFQFGLVEDSYATGNISQTGYAAGGLVGINNGIINRSYSTGTVTGEGDRGGLVGFAGRDAPSTITNSYWDAESSGLASTSGGGTSLTTAQMRQASGFAGWDFANTWVINEGVGRPTLQSLGVAPPLPPTPPPATPVPPKVPATLNHSSNDAGFISVQLKAQEPTSIAIAGSTTVVVQVANPTPIYPIDVVNNMTMEQLRNVLLVMRSSPDYVPLPVASINRFNFYKNSALDAYDKELKELTKFSIDNVFGSKKNALKITATVVSGALNVSTGWVPIAGFSSRASGKVAMTLNSMGNSDVLMRLLDMTSSGLDGDVSGIVRGLIFGSADLSGLAPEKMLKVAEAVYKMAEAGVDNGILNSSAVFKASAVVSDLAGEFSPPGPSKVALKAYSSIVDAWSVGSDVADMAQKSFDAADKILYSKFIERSDNVDRMKLKEELMLNNYY